MFGKYDVDTYNRSRIGYFGHEVTTDSLIRQAPVTWPHFRRKQLPLALATSVERDINNQLQFT